VDKRNIECNHTHSIYPFSPSQFQTLPSALSSKQYEKDVRYIVVYSCPDGQTVHAWLVFPTRKWL
jgi:hypothetical protein